MMPARGWLTSLPAATLNGRSCSKRCIVSGLLRGWSQPESRMMLAGPCLSPGWRTVLSRFAFPIT